MTIRLLSFSSLSILGFASLFTLESSFPFLFQCLWSGSPFRAALFETASILSIQGFTITTEVVTLSSSYSVLFDQ